jgi:hypothetical protein
LSTVGDDEKKSLLTSGGRKGSSFPLLNGFVNQVRFVFLAAKKWRQKNGAKKWRQNLFFFFYFLIYDFFGARKIINFHSFLFTTLLLKAAAGFEPRT